MFLFSLHATDNNRYNTQSQHHTMIPCPTLPYPPCVTFHNPTLPYSTQCYPIIQCHAHSAPPFLSIKQSLTVPYPAQRDLYLLFSCLTLPTQSYHVLTTDQVLSRPTLFRIVNSSTCL